MSERRISITVGELRVTALLDESATAELLWSELPVEGTADTWGDEIYFRTPVKAEEADDARELVDAGDMAYWPPGQALCIFFGPTPASGPGEIRPASAVNPVGRIERDVSVLKQARAGEKVLVERA